MKATKRIFGFLGLVLVLAMASGCSDILGMGDDSDGDSDAASESGG